MALSTKTRLELDAISLEQIRSSTSFTKTDRGSAIRSLMQVFNSRLAENYDALNINFTQFFVTKANGIFLDFWGDIVGLTRTNPTSANTGKVDKNIKFFTDTGTLFSVLGGDINTQTGIIPVNTKITDDLGTITYFTVEDTVFTSSDTEIFVSAAAFETGTSSNVGQNKLTKHFLGNDLVNVTNILQIANGTDLEDDDNYRFRLLRTLTANQGGNSSTLLIVALSIPGVANAQVIDLANGINTTTVLLIPSGNRLTQLTKSNATNALNTVAPFGTRVIVQEPKFVSWSLVASITFLDGVTESIKNDIRQQSEQIILNVADAAGLGGTFRLDTAFREIIVSNPQALNVEIICLNIDGKELATRSFKLKDEEMLIPDPKVKDTIKFI